MLTDVADPEDEWRKDITYIQRVDVTCGAGVVDRIGWSLCVGIGEKVTYHEQGTSADIYTRGVSHLGLLPGLVVYTGMAWHHSDTTQPHYDGKAVTLNSLPRSRPAARGWKIP